MTRLAAITSRVDTERGLLLVLELSPQLKYVVQNPALSFSTILPPHFAELILIAPSYANQAGTESLPSKKGIDD